MWSRQNRKLTEVPVQQVADLHCQSRKYLHEDLKLMTATESIQLTGHHSSEDTTNTTASMDEAHRVTGAAPSVGCIYQRAAAEPCRTL